MAGPASTLMQSLNLGPFLLLEKIPSLPTSALCHDAFSVDSLNDSPPVCDSFSLPGPDGLVH